MFKNKEFAVLNIGSLDINLMVGKCLVSGVLSITCSKSINYSGCVEGKFLDFIDATHSIRTLINSVNEKIKTPLKEIYVAVPNDFLSVKYSIGLLNFNKYKKLSKKLSEEIYDKAYENVKNVSYSLVHHSLLNFCVDSASFNSVPKKGFGAMFKGAYSFIQCSNRLINDIKTIIPQKDIKICGFLSSALCENMCCVGGLNLDSSYVSVDFGELNCSVSYYENGMMANLINLNIGFAEICNEVAEKFHLPYHVVRQFLSQYDFTSQPNQVEKSYYSDENNNNYSFYNLLVYIELMRKLDKLVSRISKTIKIVGVNKNYPCVIVSGEEVLGLSGFRQYLEFYLNNDVYIINYKLPNFKGYSYSKAISTLRVVADKKFDKSEFCLI